MGKVRDRGVARVPVAAAGKDQVVSRIITSSLTRTYLEPLLVGDRGACRLLLEDSLERGFTPRDLLVELIWPTMELVQGMYRGDRVSVRSLNMATRLNRWLADQLAARLPRAPLNGRRALVFCGDDEPEELGGQICADLFESEGWTVRFGGGGVPNDEILQLAGEFRPDLLVLFATLPQGVPAVRRLIDYLREVNACPGMQVMCCGGIYQRADGLAEEIGADLFAADGSEAVAVAARDPQRRASVEQQTVGRSRRIRKAQARKSRVNRELPPTAEAA